MKFRTKSQIKTFWIVSYFWVIFSIILAMLSTYSFIQVDWIVKRDVVVVTSYHPFWNALSHLKRLPQSTLDNNSSYYNNSTELHRYNINRNWTQFPTSIGRNSNTISINVKVNSHSNGVKVKFDSNSYNSTRGLVTKVKRTVTVISFGALGVCQNYNESYQCELYNEKRHTVSPLWPMLTLVGGSGCVTLCVSAVMSILAVALPTTFLRYQAARTIGQAQAVSVVLLFLSLLGYPLGFGSEYFRFHCGLTAGPYNVGECEVGWVYALLIVCASLAIYCPVLVHFTITTK